MMRERLGNLLHPCAPSATLVEATGTLYSAVFIPPHGLSFTPATMSQSFGKAVESHLPLCDEMAHSVAREPTALLEGVWTYSRC